MAIHAATTNSIVFLGDSVSAGWLDSGIPANPNPSQRWQKDFEASITARFAALGYPAPTYSNFGVGGQTSTGMAAAIASVVAVHPQHAYILSSVNDPANAVPPLQGTPNTVRNYETVAQALWADNPNTRVHVVSNLLWGGGTFTSELVPDSSNPNAAAVINLNSYIAQWCNAHRDKVEYLDVRADFLAWEIANNLGNAPNGQLTQTSGTHLSAAGQALASAGAWSRTSVVV